MTKHTMALVLLGFGLTACGNPGPRQPIVPSGHGWFCSVGLKSPNVCDRDEDTCKTLAYERVQKGEAEGATQAVACPSATIATCVTYNKNGKDTVTCLSDNQGCMSFASKISGSVSACQDVP